jgi:polyether ionophore transport system permease protein
VTAIVFALRLGRWGIVGFGLAAVFATAVNTFGFYAVAGDTHAERAAFGNTMFALAAQLVTILPPPIRPDTVAGYVEFRGFHALAIMFAIWALASATGFARGDEERGTLEATLATGTSRIALVVSRIVAFGIGLVVATGAAAAGFVAGVAYGHETVGVGALVQECSLQIAIGLACYTIALLVAQFAPARAAAGAAGAVLLSLYFLNSLSRTFESLSTWRWLSPFRYYDLSQPLTPGGYFDALAFAALLGVALIAGALAAAAFQLRDVGSPLFAVALRTRPASYTVTRAALWRYPVARRLYEGRVGIAAWTVGMAVLAVVLVSLTKTIVQVLLSIPALLPYISSFVRSQIYPGVLGFTWFNVAQLLFAALAITHVARWAAEDSDGRLELALSQPVSRAAVVVERMAVLVASTLVIAAATGAVLYFASHQQGIDLNPGRLVAASLMLIPFALVFAGAGSLLAAWNPRAAVGILGGFAFASYLDTELANIYKLPLWVQDLSAFKLFGTPLLTGIDWRNLTLMLLLALAGAATSILLMQRRDVGA